MEVVESDKVEDLQDNPLVKNKVDHRDEPPDQAKWGEELEEKVEVAAAVNAQWERLPSRMRMALLQLQLLLYKAMFALLHL